MTISPPVITDNQASDSRAVPGSRRSPVRYGRRRKAGRGNRRYWSGATLLLRNVPDAVELDVHRKRELVARLCRVVLEGTTRATSAEPPRTVAGDALGAPPAGKASLDARPSSVSILDDAGPPDWSRADMHRPLAMQGLSARLQQTLSRLLAGDSEKQVAGRLGVSRHTIHDYVKTLYRKFGVNSRGELFAQFVQSERVRSVPA